MPGCHDGAPNTRIWTASTLIGIEPTSAQNGGSARAYFVGLSRRQRSTVMAAHGTMAGGPAYLYGPCCTERSHTPLVVISQMRGSGDCRAPRT